MSRKKRLKCILFFTIICIFFTTNTYGENVKNNNLYTNKNVFFMGNEDWKSILTYLPAAIWTDSDGSVTAYPFLIFHDESGLESGVDAESALYFISQYAADHITVPGSLPSSLEKQLLTSGLTSSQIDYLAPDQAIDFWQSYDEVVLSADDYETALQAAVYASLLNAPLLIEGYNDTVDLSGKSVICIGDTDFSGDENLSLSQLRQSYLSKSNTDKIIITNPDLNLGISDIKTLEDGSSITYLYGQTSLSAAILAAGRQELILPVHSLDAESIDEEMNAYLLELDYYPDYLTILGSPLEIQQTILVDCSYTDSSGYHEEFSNHSIDNTLYGNMDNDATGFVELKTGRIYGFTISDTSSYIARSLFYEVLPRGDDMLFIGEGVGSCDEDAAILSAAFASEGYSSDYRTYDNPTMPEDWARKFFINSSAHGNYSISTILTEEIPWLSHPFIITSSCLIASFDSLIPYRYGRLFAAQLLRKGAMGIVASTDTNGFTFDMTRINGIFTKDAGTMFKEDRNTHHNRGIWHLNNSDTLSEKFYRLSSDIQFLLGDPAFKMEAGPALLPEKEYSVSYTPNATTINLTLPTKNIQGSENIKLLAEGTETFYSPSYSRMHFNIGPIDLFKSYSIECDQAQDTIIKEIKDIAVQKEKDGYYLNIMLIAEFSADPLNLTTDNRFQIVLNKTTPQITVTAGSNQSIDLYDSAILTGSCSSPSALVQWSKVSGPGLVFFEDSSSLDTSAVFSRAGSYILRLEARENDLKNYAEVEITVNNTAITPTPNATPTATPTPTPIGEPECYTAPAWDAASIYSIPGTKVIYNGSLYENKWYSANQNPEENSGLWDVWTLISTCGEVTPTPVITPTPTPEITITPSPTPIVTETPSPVITPSPTPVTTQTPTPVVTPSPTPIVTETPTPLITPSPSETPEPTPTPDQGSCPIVSTGFTFETSDAICFKTQYPINGWGGSSMDKRSVSVTVNGTGTAVTTIGGQLPPKNADDFYVFEFSAGSYAWAAVYWW